jgi:hypothetical protein
MRKNIIFVMLLLFFHNGCSFLREEKIYTIFKYENIEQKVFNNSIGYDLTIDDIKKISIILKKCINNYNTEIENTFLEFIKSSEKNIENEKYRNIYERVKNIGVEQQIMIKSHFINLEDYKRQYVAIINENGEKEVWVNCFHNEYKNSDWKKEIIQYYDGGNKFFNVKINLTKSEYYGLWINGI